MEKYSKGQDDDTKRCSINRIPSFVELLSYILYPGTCYVGPFFEFKDYIDFIEERNGYTNIPLCLGRASVKYLKGFACFGVIVFIGSIVDISYLSQSEYGNETFFLKMVYMYLAVSKFKYTGYSIWCFTDGANMLSGLGYSGEGQALNDEPQGNITKTYPKFERNIGIKISSIEFASCPRDVINNWNIQTMVWLRKYVYDRIKQGKKENEGIATLVTFMVSAFWHGFEAGYYIFFYYVHVLLTVSRWIYKRKEVFSFMPPLLRHILCNFLSIFCIHYMGCVFVMRRLGSGWEFMKHTYFIGLWPVSMAYVLMKLIPDNLSKSVRVHRFKTATNETDQSGVRRSYSPPEECSSGKMKTS